MRAIITLILLFFVYQAVKTVFRAAVTAYRGDERVPHRVPGEEMVQDPECRTFVVKNRAVARSVGGRTAYFCSAACADAYERRGRSA